MAIVGAAAGGALFRENREMGALPKEAAITVDSRTLVASYDTNLELSESDFFYRLTRLLQEEFVDPVEDVEKLAIGSVRGMIGSLSDPNAIFMPKDQFQAYLSVLQGQAQGVGVEVELRYDPAQVARFREAQAKLADWNANGRKEIDGKLEELPNLEPGALLPDVIVGAVYPGSPADKAGIRAGDYLLGVGGKNIVTRREVTELNEAFNGILKGTMDRKVYEQMRERYTERSKNSVTPNRVREKLMLGSAGSIEVSWKAPKGEVKKATLTKSKTTIQPLEGEQLRFIQGAPEAFAAALAQGRTNFDLRNSGTGSFEALKATLGKALPSGDYGFIRTNRQSPAKPMRIEGSGSLERRFTLRVDATTQGAARVFAEVLRDAGVATLDGRLSTEPAYIFEVVSLQDGSGYQLPVGVYSAKGARS